MLDYNEKMLLVNELIGQLENDGSFRETLLGPFIGTPFTERLPLQPKIRPLVLEAIRQWNDTSGWRNDPSALRLLFDGLGLAPMTVNLAQLDARITEIDAANKQHRTTGTNQRLATILAGNMPFVNRIQFRQQLMELADPTATQNPILVVEGGAKTGKSYSVEYIDHVKFLNAPLIDTYFCAFDPEQGFDLGPEDLASDLLSLMGRQMDEEDRPSKKTNLKKYTRDLALRVLNTATQLADSQHWFVLDNYIGDSLRADTREFLKALSAEVTNGQFPNRCRLILLGVDRDLLSLVRTSKIRKDSVAACTQTDIETTLGEILNQTPTVRVAAVLPFILNNLPTDSEKMWEVNRRLRLLLIAVNRLAKLVIEPNDFQLEVVLLDRLSQLPKATKQTHDERRKEARAIEDMLETLMDELQTQLIDLRQR